MDVTDQVLYDEETIRYKRGEFPHVLMNVALFANQKESDTQFLCTEMQHWDDYRERFAIQDGTGKMIDTMKKLMKTSVEPFKGYTFKIQQTNVKALSIALNPAVMDSAKQIFCTEMQHWDDYRETNNIRDGLQSMKELFSSNSFSGSEIFILDARGKLVKVKSMCITASRDFFAKDLQPLCTEMIHWDDYQMTCGIQPNPKMEALFGKQ